METDKDMKPKNALAEIAEVLKNESAPSTESFKKKAIEHFGKERWKRHEERKHKMYLAYLIIEQLSKLENKPGMDEPWWGSCAGCIRRCRNIAEMKMEVK